ncbi:hypothetical protein ONR57_07665 [Hoyosella sp. YIM 151337]|uniref:hypothetical protein n=1 Tax=Hoyosella sp. YIM 151337 TaxID=2992742 RepID=UPI00223670D5|nr:hypothetical protein [Hoyosella sp. YIM 151337]MCW4353173.1 hypothetical protein [Hoyosella sp. YIM 151337]
MSDQQKSATEGAGPVIPSGVLPAVREFIKDHGGSAKAVLQNLGRIGVRITLVGADGVMGDQVVPNMEAAKAVVDAVPDLEAAEWDRELTSTATPAPEHARRMAGWLANS